MNECQVCGPPIVACRHVDGHLRAFVAKVETYPEKPWLWTVSPWADEGDDQARVGYVATREEAIALMNDPPAFDRD